MAVLDRQGSARPKTPKALAERAYETSNEAQGSFGQTLGAVGHGKMPALHDFPPKRLKSSFDGGLHSGGALARAFVCLGGNVEYQLRG